MSAAAAAAVASASWNRSRGRRGRRLLARGSAGAVAMEDFIVISDDSGSESSAGTRSGRARRLRRALSRTPGALPRRTVVSPLPLAAPDGGRASPARGLGVAAPARRRRVFPPLAASGLEERGGASVRAGLGLARSDPCGTVPRSGPSTWATRCAPVRAAGRRPPARRGPRALASGRRWGSWSGRSRHPDLEAGARERVIVWLLMGTDVYWEVTGARAASERSAALGTVAAAPGA